MTIHIYEAVCPKCGETFNPDGPEDLTHINVGDGTDCGTVDHYWEHHTEGYSVEVHTSLTELQEALVERISHPERRHPRIKFRPSQETPQHSLRGTVTGRLHHERSNLEEVERPLNMVVIDQESQVREIMELLRPLDF